MAVEVDVAGIAVAAVERTQGREIGHMREQEVRSYLKSELADY